MKKILVLMSLFVGLSASAEIFKSGHPSSIKIDSDGLVFKLACEPTSNSGLAELRTFAKQMAEDLKNKLSEVHCEVLRIKNPEIACGKSAESISKCGPEPRIKFLVPASEPNIMNVLMSAFQSQSSVSVSGEYDIETHKVVVDYVEID